MISCPHIYSGKINRCDIIIVRNSRLSMEYDHPMLYFGCLLVALTYFTKP